jgi:hypothetical protein
MPKTFKQLCEDAAAKTLPIVNGEAVDRATFEGNASVLKKLLTFGIPVHERPVLDMKEALGSADASILFKRVVDDILVRPTEPTAIASTRLSQTINVDARSFTFPTMGAIRAGEVSEAGDYPEATPGFGEMATEVRTKKQGIVIPINEDVIADSQWDIVSLFIEAARNAMIRRKEELCFSEFSTSATVVYDNGYPSGSTTARIAAQTRGIDVNGNFNGTVSFKDFVVMLGVLVTNGYTPTDFTIHPMSWSVFINDPIMRFLMLQNGQAAQTIAQLGPDAIGGSIPWAFQTNVSPFVPYTASKENFLLSKATSTASSSITGPTTEMYISTVITPLLFFRKSLCPSKR